MSRGNGQGRNRLQRWREEFPLHWDADESVGRREFLRFTVLTSGALFAGTALLALLGRTDDRTRGEPQPIADVDELPESGPHYFHYPTDDDQAVLLRTESGGFVAYSQRCTHLSCSVYYQEDHARLFCPCHDGVFDPATGEPTAGPPQRRLPRILLEERDGMLYALREEP